MFAIVLACLLSDLLAAFALKVGMDLSWPVIGIICAMLALLMFAAVFYFRADTVKAHLVADLGTLWRRWSTRLAGVQATGVIAFWGLAPAEWKAAVPNWALFALMVFFGLCFIVAQAIKQSSLTPPGQ